MKERYRAAHRAARLNRRAGRWWCNPIRLVDGYPGVFVGAGGELRGFYGFDRNPLFPPLEIGYRETR